MKNFDLMPREIAGREWRVFGYQRQAWALRREQALARHPAYRTRHSFHPAYYTVTPFVSAQDRLADRQRERRVRRQCREAVRVTV